MNQIQQLLPLVILGGIFYFLVIRPQQQRAKQHAETVAALVPGVEIVTIGGIFATVVSTGERVRVRVADGSELEVSPNAVARVVTPASDVVAPSGAAESTESAEDMSGDDASA